MALRTESKIVNQGSKVEWLPAIVICFPYICGILAINGISIVLSITLIAIAGCNLMTKRFKLPTIYIFTVSFIVAAFIISFLRVENTEYTIDYLERFILYGMVALLVGMQDVNKEGVLKGVTIIGLILLPLMLVNNYMEIGQHAAMGASYMSMPIIIAAMTEFALTQERKYKIFSSIVTIGILGKYITMANRGVWLILITFAFIMVYLRICRSGKQESKRILAYAFLIATLILALIIVVNFEAIVLWLYNFINDVFHIRLYALWKIQYYLNKGDLLNGRSGTIGLAIEIAKTNILFGRGIGYYETQSGGSYCHNIFFQLICEGGIFMFLPGAYYIAKIIIRIFNQPLKRDFSLKDYRWNVFLFCCGIEMLFYSSVYWTYMLFWFFWGSFLVSRKKSYISE